MPDGSSEGGQPGKVFNGRNFDTCQFQVIISPVKEYQYRQQQSQPEKIRHCKTCIIEIVKKQFNYC